MHHIFVNLAAEVVSTWRGGGRWRSYLPRSQWKQRSRPLFPPLKQDRAAGWVRPYSSSRRPPSPDAAWRAASLVTLHTASFRCSEQINMLSSYEIMRKKWEGGSRWSHLVTVVLIQPRRPSTHPSQFTNPWVLACLPAPALCPWMPQKQPDL